VDLETARTDGTTRLTIVGELDLATADELVASGTLALDDPGCSRLLLDLSGVGFIDSTGLGTLVHLSNAAKRTDTALVLCDPAPRVVEVLRLTAMEDFFEVTKS
jgi:anti-anti-sigma factor